MKPVEKTKILIVDDEKIVTVAYARELEDLGYEVFKALSAREAIESVKREKPRVVFTDLILPGTNGVELCRQIKSIDPKVEVVLMSGYTSETGRYMADFIEAGGSSKWLEKPLPEGELRRIIEEILKESPGG